MDKPIRTIAIIAMMSLAAAGCQKEDLTDPAATVSPVTMRTVTYSVDGVTTQITLLGDKAWHDFLDWMFALAEEGHRVTFRQGNAELRNMTKETVTFTTNSQEEAKNWSLMMIGYGYEVTVTYNDKTGIYTCTATR